MRIFVRLSHLAANFYEILEVPRSCSSSDIKTQFKKLSKKYHPDMNNHLSEEDKKANSEKFIRIVNAYETLNDKNKKAEYDRMLTAGGTGSYGKMHAGDGQYRDDYSSPYSYNNSRKEWENQYYGQSNYHGGSRMNRTRHRVRSFNDFDDSNTAFRGEHKNYGDRFNVPHFNYQEHLLKHLKFEQRIINKNLTEEEREYILQQLTKNADKLDISEELITKHLMRQANSKSRRTDFRETINMSQSNPFIYREPSTMLYSKYEDETDYDDGSTLKLMCLIGGTTGSLFLAYKLFGGK